MRQNVCEARKTFPLRRGSGEAMIESGIQYKIFPDRIQDGPQIPDGMSAGEGLREMPEFDCDRQLRLIATVQFSMLVPANKGFVMI
jgi:hypothetical protein